MYILGISCFYHDSAACLVKDGEIVAAASEERFTRKKHDPDYPAQAIAYCLQEAGIQPAELDYVAFYDKPLLKFERLLKMYMASFPRSFSSFRRAMPVWLKEKLWTPQIIRRELDDYAGPVLFLEHHMSHAASAFFVSPFDKAAILTVDGVGEWATAAWGTGEGNRIELVDEIRFPHSLGMLYSAFTYYLGFKVNSAEYKVMGLSPYGEPRYANLIKQHLIKIADDGSFRLNMDYFAYHYGLTMTNERFDKLFGGPPRQPEAELTQREKDLAMSVQKVTEEVVLKMARSLHQKTGLKDLCMAGGVALNCVANGRLLREGPFERIFVQPAAGDAGGAVGAAMYVWHSVLDKPRDFVLPHSYWGPGFDDNAIESFLDQHGVPYERLERPQLLERTAKQIEDQKVVGWFQGRMEFGPRALGSRSILADPRVAENRDRVNLKIKFRESFRPFAPVALLERAPDYFDLRAPDPYMLFVSDVLPDKRVIPAVTHVDGSARLQTVERDVNPLYYDLIAAFEKRTGTPVLINTSFNVRGEPIVCSPEDAYSCFLRTDMDVLVMGRTTMEKIEGRHFPQVGPEREFEPD
jgi:carbamoyltransferase